MGEVPRHHRDLSEHETIYEAADDAARDALRTHEQRVTVGVVAGGTSLETLGGFAALVLAVIGLARTEQLVCAAVATIIVGAALAIQGGSVMVRWNDALRRAQGLRYDRSELVSGISTELFGGIVGIALGVLALAHVRPPLMLEVAVIVFGIALLLGGAAQPTLGELRPGLPARHAFALQDAVLATSGLMVTVGIGVAVLGVLALIGVGAPETLALAALACIGGSLVITGSTVTARLVRRQRR